MKFDRINYCPACRTKLNDKQIEGRMRRYCQQCEQPIYQNPKPCAGVLVIDDCERVLLIKRTEPPAPGAWSVPAGYLEADEPPSHAAVRELHEETNITLSEDGLQLLDTIFVRHPDGQHVLVIVYTALRSTTTGRVIPGSDAADAQFWSLSELRRSEEKVELGYDAILEQALNSIQ